MAIMQTLATSLFLILLTCSGCESEKHEIIPSGTIWLDENVTLYITIANMKRPVVWQSLNYKYECDRVCANGTYYKVTQKGNSSSLWIRSVSWKFAKWKFYDDNLDFARIELDINVKPKIEIKNTTSCEYKVMAQCSLPLTHMKCLHNMKPLEFTDTVKSNCSDGKTFSNVGTLNFQKFSGNVNCSFTIDKIFKEYRELQIECGGPVPWICSIAIVLLCVSLFLFIVMIIAVIIGWIKGENGKDFAPWMCVNNVVYLCVSVLLLIVTTIAVIFGCIKGEDPAPWISPTTLGLLCVSVFLFIVMIIAVIIEWVKGKDFAPWMCVNNVVYLCVSVLLLIVATIAVIFGCIKDKELLAGSHTSVIVLLVALFISLIITGFSLVNDFQQMKTLKAEDESKKLVSN